ncbi:MAG TPA: 2-hydroxyacid dehydrogenase [Nitrososphaerales archaeon]|nr:2-hydroxyacid dehydrogenase [Nitrososphaerales archaeon]
MSQVLVTSEVLGSENLKRLSKVAQVVESWKLDKEAIEDVLPKIDAAIIFSWPSFFTRENLAQMRRLRFIQTVLVGVNHVSFGDLPKDVMVCSNAGAYSVEVGEHAWALLMAAAKKMVSQHIAVRERNRTLKSFRGDEKDVKVLKGATLGVIGLGNIGSTVAKFGQAFGMKVIAFNRSRRKVRGVRAYYGKRGLDRVLKASDAVILAVPLNRSTDRLIGAMELDLMKKDAVIVNIARGDLVDQDSLYSHLVANPSFRYATDVWWFKEGEETLETVKPLTNLPNFIGTPHSSGFVSFMGGGPQRQATENTIRFLRGRTPKNVVDRSDYATRENTV